MPGMGWKPDTRVSKLTKAGGIAANMPVIQAPSCLLIRFLLIPLHSLTFGNYLIGKREEFFSIPHDRHDECYDNNYDFSVRSSWSQSIKKLSKKIDEIRTLDIKSSGIFDGEEVKRRQCSLAFVETRYWIGWKINKFPIVEILKVGMKRTKTTNCVRRDGAAFSFTRDAFRAYFDVTTCCG